jgi:hypothetical protein
MTEGGMARRGASAQRDLFAPAMPVNGPPQEVRCTLLALLEALLREVTATGTAAREGSGEQDHA